MTTPPRTTAVLVTLVVVGLAFGVFTSAVNHTPGWAVVSKVVGVGWSWAAVGIVVAAIARRRQTLSVMTVLLAAVAGYYAADLAAGSYNTIDFADPQAAADPMNAVPVVLWSAALQDFLFWVACVLVVSWPLARIGVAVHRHDVWGLLARIAIPLGAAVEMLTLRLPGELALQPNAVTVLVYVAVVAIGVISALLLCALFVRDARRTSGGKG